MADETPPGWIDPETLSQLFSRPAVLPGSGGEEDRQAPINMPVDQFIGLDRGSQNHILETWGGLSVGVPVQGLAGNQSDPNANLISALWLKADDPARARYLDPYVPHTSFANAMLGPEASTRQGQFPTPFSPPAFGQGGWTKELLPETGNRNPVWHFSKFSQPELDDLVAQGRYAGTPEALEQRRQQDNVQPFGTMAPAPAPAPGTLEAEGAKIAPGGSKPIAQTAQDYINSYMNWLATGRWGL
jgi:hypothetical protein